MTTQAQNIIEMPNDILFAAIYEEMRKGHTVTIRAKGNSMRPFIESCRDLVKLQNIQPEALKIGDVILAETTDQRTVLHRIVGISGQDITLLGDGNLYFTETCHPEGVRAKAIAFYRKGRNKPDTINSYKWRIYSTLWMQLRPIRRYLLAFYRLIWLRLFPVKIHLK